MLAMYFTTFSDMVVWIKIYVLGDVKVLYPKFHLNIPFDFFFKVIEYRIVLFGVWIQCLLACANSLLHEFGKGLYVNFIYYHVMSFISLQSVSWILSIRL